MSSALTLTTRPPELSWHATSVLKYLRRHCDHAGFLEPGRVELWIDKGDAFFSAVLELIDCGIITLDDQDRYVVAREVG